MYIKVSSLRAAAYDPGSPVRPLPVSPLHTHAIEAQKKNAVRKAAGTPKSTGLGFVFFAIHRAGPSSRISGRKVRLVARGGWAPRCKKAPCEARCNAVFVCESSAVGEKEEKKGPAGDSIVPAPEKRNG